MITLSSDTDEHTVKQRRLTDLLCILCMQTPNQVLKVTHHSIRLKFTKNACASMCHSQDNRIWSSHMVGVSPN